MVDKNLMYNALVWYEHLLWHLKLNLEAAEKMKNSFDSSLFFFNNKKAKTNIDKKFYEKIFQLNYSIATLEIDFSRDVIEEIKKDVCITEKRVNGLRRVLIKAGDARV